MWKHKESKWLVRGGRKVKCYLCGKKVLAKGDLFLFHGDTGYYSHQSCTTESTTISGNERRKAVKKIAVGAAVVGAIAAGAGKLIDISSQSKGSNSPAAQTILTSQGLIPPALTSDPANPVPGQMWYRSDAGVEAHFDGVQNRVVYSSEINDGNVNVTSKGIINGLSVLPNDGKGGFGPDTTKGATAPGQYGSPYTQTSGIQEGADFIMQTPTGGKVKLLGGLFMISQTINITNNSSGDIPIYIEGSGAGNFGNQTYPDTSTSQGTLLYAANGLNANMIYVNNAPGGYLKISDIHFFGNPDNNASPSGTSIAMITFNDGFQSEVSRCIFDNPPHSGYAIFTVDGMGLSYLNINKSLFQNAIAGITGQENGMIYINPLSSSNQTSGAGPYIIEDCYFYNTVATHIFSDAPNTIIKSNFFQEMVNAINVEAINAQIEGNIILSNSSSTSAYQIQTSGYNAVIHGNIFLYAGYQNILVNGGSTKIYGNYFDGTTGDGSTTAQTTYALNVPVSLASVSKGGVIFENNTFIGAYLSSFPFSYVSNTGLIIRNNYNMSGAGIVLSPSTPSVPASGTAQENTNPFPVNVYIYGGDVTEIQITKNGTAHTVLSVSTAIAMSGQAYKVNPGDSITVTYSTAPTWEWLTD